MHHLFKGVKGKFTSKNKSPVKRDTSAEVKAERDKLYEAAKHYNKDMGDTGNDLPQTRGGTTGNGTTAPSTENPLRGNVAARVETPDDTPQEEKRPVENNAESVRYSIFASSFFADHGGDANAASTCSSDNVVVGSSSRRNTTSALPPAPPAAVDGEHSEDELESRFKRLISSANRPSSSSNHSAAVSDTTGAYSMVPVARYNREKPTESNATSSGPTTALPRPTAAKREGDPPLYSMVPPARARENSASSDRETTAQPSKKVEKSDKAKSPVADKSKKGVAGLKDNIRTKLGMKEGKAEKPAETAPPSPEKGEEVPASHLRRTAQPNTAQWEYVTLFLSKAKRNMETKVRESRCNRPIQNEAATEQAEAPPESIFSYSFSGSTLTDDEGNPIRPPTPTTLGLMDPQSSSSSSPCEETEDEDGGEESFNMDFYQEGSHRSSSASRDANSERFFSVVKRDRAAQEHQQQEQQKRLAEKQMAYLRREREEHIRNMAKQDIRRGPAANPPQTGRWVMTPLATPAVPPGYTPQPPPAQPAQQQYHRYNAAEGQPTSPKAPQRKKYVPVASHLPPPPAKVRGTTLNFVPRHPVPCPQPDLNGPDVLPPDDEPDMSHMVTFRYRDIRTVDSPVRKRKPKHRSKS
ncbi:dentin sialophosphoprotein precursor [Angomonas deanei]|uniref:Uncharacterized protein n=1 Tax=Angomonas deanei TaxID=59799 RepID=A0A7G2C1D6_9TRYP|nr:dentin sialophosphoprotein precursor [Angomonas deanei]CAD2213578.1 hypothetical protein, conserved [Angomonas deanei]|eukprot:EPY16621.1 dentin sialophosphoprotein precursor [Angomonas deanei]